MLTMVVPTAVIVPEVGKFAGTVPWMVSVVAPALAAATGAWITCGVALAVGVAVAVAGVPVVAVGVALGFVVGVALGFVVGVLVGGLVGVLVGGLVGVLVGGTGVLVGGVTGGGVPPTVTVPAPAVKVLLISLPLGSRAPIWDRVS